MKILRIIICSPIAFLRLLIIVLITAYVTIGGWFCFKLKGFSRNLQQWVIGTWGRGCMFVCGIKVDRNKLPEADNFILMPNHRSYIDIFIVAGLTPAAMVGKAEIGKWPFGDLGARITNSILVDRRDPKSLLHAMRMIKGSVSAGMPVILFPEGTTHKGPLTKNFKNGSFKIAADGNIPVIPMAINYKDVDDAWVGDDTFIGHFFRQMGKPVTKVSVRYGSSIADSDCKSLQHKIKMQIDEMLKGVL